MRLPHARGELSAQLLDVLATGRPVSAEVGLTAAKANDEDDGHLALWTLYELHYRGFEEVDPDAEWDPHLLALRAELEEPFEATLRELVAEDVEAAKAESDDVVVQLEQLTAEQPGELARYMQRDATAEEYREFLAQRSVYHLKESDPHAWAIPRLDGPAKVALAELQYDEFGGGIAAHLHSHLYAEALTGAGLDPSYGAHVDRASWQTLAANNAMSLFGLHRRLRGAAMGHLAAFEMTSSLPCRRYLQGAERLDLDPRVAHYFDEHVEADAVHEQIAARTICGSLVTAEPALHDDVLLGAAACMRLESMAGAQMLESWAAGRTSLRGSDERSAA